MPQPLGGLNVKLDSEAGARICRALSAHQRVALLGLLSEGARNIVEIAAELGLSQPTASAHIRVLEEAGLIECEYISTGRGSEKRCWVKYDSLTLEMQRPSGEPEEKVQEVSMPLGLFTGISVQPTCGIASSSRIIGFMDNEQSFLLPERAEAQLMWFGAGWVEYSFPCELPPTAEITGIELTAELCSEAPNHDDSWPSDITVWMNGVETGTWTSPSDYGGRRGRLNPDWWSDSLTQHGALKSWTVNAEGSFVDGTPAGKAVLADLDIDCRRPIVVRIGNRPDAPHIGGVNLFGRHFGNYPQDILLRIRYRLKSFGQISESVRNLMERPESDSIDISRGD